MDDLDVRILDLLGRDGRMHVATLATELGVPRSTAQERLRRLQVTGVVRGFRPILDHAKLGRPTLAYILATFQPGSGAKHRQAVRDLLRIDGIERVDMVSGEWDILIRVRGASLEAIGDLIIDRLRTMPSIARTVTMPSFHGEERDGAPG